MQEGKLVRGSEAGGLASQVEIARARLAFGSEDGVEIRYREGRDVPGSRGAPGADQAVEEVQYLMRADECGARISDRSW